MNKKTSIIFCSIDHDLFHLTFPLPDLSLIIIFSSSMQRVLIPILYLFSLLSVFILFCNAQTSLPSLGRLQASLASRKTPFSVGLLSLGYRKRRVSCAMQRPFEHESSAFEKTLCSPILHDFEQRQGDYLASWISPQPMTSLPLSKEPVTDSWISVLRQEALTYGSQKEALPYQRHLKQLMASMERQLLINYPEIQPAVFYQEWEVKMNLYLQSRYTQLQRRLKREEMMPFEMLRFTAQGLALHRLTDLDVSMNELFRNLLAVAEQPQYQPAAYVLAIILMNSDPAQFQSLVSQFMKYETFRVYILSVMYQSLLEVLAEKMFIYKHPKYMRLAAISLQAFNQPPESVPISPSVAAMTLAYPTLHFSGSRLDIILKHYFMIGKALGLQAHLVFQSILYQALAKMQMLRISDSTQQVLASQFAFLSEESLSSTALKAACSIGFQEGAQDIEWSGFERHPFLQSTIIALYTSQKDETQPKRQAILFRDYKLANYVLDTHILLETAQSSTLSSNSHRLVLMPGPLILTHHHLKLAGWMQPMQMHQTKHVHAQSTHEFYGRVRPMLQTLGLLKRDLQFIHGRICPSFITDTDRLTLIATVTDEIQVAPFSVFDRTKKDVDALDLLRAVLEIHAKLLHNVSKSKEGEWRADEFMDLVGAVQDASHSSRGRWQVTVKVEEVLGHPFFQ